MAPAGSGTDMAGYVSRTLSDFIGRHRTRLETAVWDGRFLERIMALPSRHKEPRMTTQAAKNNAIDGLVEQSEQINELLRGVLISHAKGEGEDAIEGLEKVIDKLRLMGRLLPKAITFDEIKAVAAMGAGAEDEAIDGVISELMSVEYLIDCGKVMDARLRVADLLQNLRKTHPE